MTYIDVLKEIESKGIVEWSPETFIMIKKAVIKQIVDAGDKIRIVYMDGEPTYLDRIGIVTRIDDAGQLHGTWGRLAVNLEIDDIEVIKKCKKSI